MDILTVRKESSGQLFGQVACRVALPLLARPAPRFGA